MSGFLTAASLLTRIPTGNRSWAEPDLARAVPWFAVVGGFLGAFLSGAYAGLVVLFPPLLAAALTVGLGVGLTGAFHEDGLADTFDALGGRTRDESLRILKDPTHGTFGVIAIVFSVVLRTGALAVLDAWAAVAFLPTAHALSRAASAVLLGVASPAAPGLGASYASAASGMAATVAALTAAVLGVAFAGVWVLPATLSVLVGAGAMGLVSVRRFGGITGDALGAAQQVGEVAVMVLAAAVVANGSASVPWWR